MGARACPTDTRSGPSCSTSGRGWRYRRGARDRLGAAPASPVGSQGIWHSSSSPGVAAATRRDADIERWRPARAARSGSTTSAYRRTTPRRLQPVHDRHSNESRGRGSDKRRKHRYHQVWLHSANCSRKPHNSREPCCKGGVARGEHNFVGRRVLRQVAAPSLSNDDAFGLRRGLSHVDCGALSATGVQARHDERNAAPRMSLLPPTGGRRLRRRCRPRSARTCNGLSLGREAPERACYAALGTRALSMPWCSFFSDLARLLAFECNREVTLLERR